MRSKRSHSGTNETDEEMEISGRVVGTVRRHIPIDTRDPLGATLHFYVGDSNDSSRLVFFCLKNGLFISLDCSFSSQIFIQCRNMLILIKKF